MDPIVKAIQEVKFQIPPQILSLVFSPTGRQFAHHAGAIDSAIRDKIIDARVRVDCDIAGAVEVEIPLAGVRPEIINRFAMVYVVPKTILNGRRITSALALAYGQNALYGAGSQVSINSMGQAGCGYTPLLDKANAIVHANAPINIVQTARVSMIGENVVLIEDYMPIARDPWLRCLVSHDSEFTTIKGQTLFDFAQLVVYATKAYIYNNFYIELGSGYLHGGMELGQIKDTIDNYADANELYQTFYREKWRKTSFLNDPARKHRAIRAMMGGKG